MRPLATAAVLLTALAADAAPKKFNVLFIASDDLNTDLGCYGHPLVKSPNIDRLAASGVRFERAFCQYPVCSPSRASFLLGRRPENTGVLSNPGRNISPHFREFIPRAVSLPQHFKKNGYFAARVGKLYHYNVPKNIGNGGLDDPESWDKTVNPRGIDKERERDIFTLQRGRYGATLSWLEVGGDADHTDGIGATEAIELMEKYGGRPFFLAVGFYRPHTPYVAPKKYFDMYPLEKIRLPKDPAGYRDGVPKAAFLSQRKVEDDMTDELRKKAIRAYYASVTYMDAQVGRVLDALERLKLRDRTIVVFLSDHGYHLGDHSLWQKMSLYDRATQVPLIVSVPGVKGNGGSAGGVVELVDLYPTLAEACGLKIPGGLDGVSLMPTLRDPSKSVRESALTTIRRGGFLGYGLRTPRYRYNEWDGGKRGVELYDHKSDPGEYKNLAGNSDYAEVQKRLTSEMKKRRPKQIVRPKLPR